MTEGEVKDVKRISIDLPIDLIDGVDRLRKEWGLRRRGLVFERLLKVILSKDLDEEIIENERHDPNHNNNHDSITDKNGIAPEDEITKINSKAIKGKISDLLKGCEKEATLTIKKKFSEKTISLAIGNYYGLLEFKKKEAATKEQLTLRKVWSS